MTTDIDYIITIRPYIVYNVLTKVLTKRLKKTLDENQPLEQYCISGKTKQGDLK